MIKLISERAKGGDEEMKLKARVIQIHKVGENGRQVVQLNIANWNEELQQITTGPTDTCTIYIDRAEDQNYLENGREYFLEFVPKDREIVDKIADQGTFVDKIEDAKNVKIETNPSFNLDDFLKQK